MTMTSVSAVEELDAAAALFHGFSDPHRIAVLRHLAHGEHRIVDLTAHLGLAQSTVSQHVACLRGCGLLTSRTEGRSTLYSLAHPAALEALWTAAERVLDLTGQQVALCTRQGDAS